MQTVAWKLILYHSIIWCKVKKIKVGNKNANEKNDWNPTAIMLRDHSEITLELPSEHILSLPIRFTMDCDGLSDSFRIRLKPHIESPKSTLYSPISRIPLKW